MNGKRGPPLKEELVIVPSCVWPRRNSCETIEVQLALETAQSTLLEELGHHLTYESLWVQDGEGAAVGEERDDVGHSVSLGVFQHAVKSFWERLCHTATGATIGNLRRVWIRQLRRIEVG
eukprot:CAMPEP_0194032078 /NCGR_PEP_ID=MMETSP0009_2-20130614/5105_1 /TAXON_ID=210454 /ORGANISM="Grammatophora oceanica, Strain CCMP 410" /LENGTH=119 /DNA_ID=CAMNT_0038672417 /DNA_START=194 /DNA_END=553 /DNA_ORIENTATION=-